MRPLRGVRRQAARCLTRPVTPEVAGSSPVAPAPGVGQPAPATRGGSGEGDERTQHCGDTAGARRPARAGIRYDGRHLRRAARLERSPSYRPRGRQARAPGRREYGAPLLFSGHAAALAFRGFFRGEAGRPSRESREGLPPAGVRDRRAIVPRLPPRPSVSFSRCRSRLRPARTLALHAPRSPRLRVRPRDLPTTTLRAH
jgi:hypothetical protein